MGLKKGAGNMYPWVTHTHSHLVGQCPHECSYCYVQAMDKRYGSKRHSGPVQLNEDEFKVKYGAGRTIFIEHMNDLFAEGVSDQDVLAILGHCVAFPENTYVLQTKNPERMLFWAALWPAHRVLGTTIETNRPIDSKAPSAEDRARAMGQIRAKYPVTHTFITVEPILDFDVEELAGLITLAQPTFVNIGADSKGHNLVEPTAEKIRAFVAILQQRQIEIRQKHNLERLLGQAVV